MKPYGWKKDSWRDEDYGPPSRYSGGVVRGRREWRRIMHKRGRRTARKQIAEQLTIDTPDE